MKNKKHVSDVLTIEELNKHGNRIGIVAGVGAGKNHWVEYVLSEQYRVLFITSRAIVRKEATRKNLKKDGWVKQAHNCLYTDGKLNHYVILTNAGFVKALKEAENMNAFLEDMEKFDYVVIDEVHSIVTDSTFTDSGFYIWNFITLLKKAKVILMSATAEILSDGLDQRGFAKVDLTKECVNLKPENITIISKKTAERMLEEYDENNKAVYFANSATAIYSEYIKKHSETNTNSGVIACIIASSRENELDGELAEIMKDCTTEIIENNKIPDDVKILFATSTLKEGANINDSRVKDVFAETHYIYDLIQYAGRIRSGIKNLFIIDNAQQHTNKYDREIVDFQRAIIPRLNDEVYQMSARESICLNEDRIVLKNPLLIDKRSKFIKYYEGKHEFIKFDLFRGRFRLFVQKKIAHEVLIQANARYKENKIEYLRTWFGIENIFDAVETDAQLMARKLTENDLIGKCLAIEEKQVILKWIEEEGIVNANQKPYKQLASCLKRFGYEVVDLQDKRTFKIIKIE